MTVCGTVVLDICQHFIERWNEVKKRKVNFSLYNLVSLRIYPLVISSTRRKSMSMTVYVHTFVSLLDHSHIDWLAFPHNTAVSPNEAIASA